MRLAWTAIVPRSLVEEATPRSFTPLGRQILSVEPHPNPALRIVRCYQRDHRAESLPAA
ncbi:MAG TPA: hypothetical protein VII06_19535 [Chloroflexota bacterium]|jgi:hypothetical protein